MKTLLTRQLPLVLAASPALHAQGLGNPATLPTLPDGYANTALWDSGLVEDRPLGSLNFSLSANATYDSNVNRASGAGMESEESDFILGASLRGSYMLGDQSWRVGVNANVGYREYFERGEFSDINYGLSFNGGFNTAKTVISYTIGLSFDSGVDVRTSEFNEQLRLNNSLTARYRLSGKTSILGSFSHSPSFSDTDGFNDTTSWSANLSGIWQATPKINMGPGVSYSVRSGTGGSEIVRIGPTFRLNYDFSSKVTLRSSIGYSFTDDSDDSDSLNWSLGLNYQLTSRWGLNLALVRDLEATPSRDSGFNESTSVRLNLTRKFGRANANIGISYQDRSAVTNRAAANVVGDSELITTTAGLSMPIFQRKANLAWNVSYRNYDGAADRSWDGYQTGLSVTYRF